MSARTGSLPSGNDVRERLNAVVKDMLTSPKTYAVTAIELEGMLFALMRIYAEAIGKTDLFTKRLSEIRDDNTLEFGGFCRTFHNDFFPCLESCSSQDSFDAVTSPFAKVFGSLGAGKSNGSGLFDE